MKRPATSPALSFSQLDFFPPEKWISFLCWIGFLATWHSHQSGQWRGGGFNEKSKDQMLQAGLQSSQLAPYLDVWEEFYVQLQIRRFPACVMSPPKLATPITADIQYRSPIKVKFYIFYALNLVFMTIQEGFGHFHFQALFSLKHNLVRFNGYSYSVSRFSL